MGRRGKKDEEFKRINGFEDYEISSFGRVYSIKSGKFRKLIKEEYLTICLCIKSKKFRRYVHLLVASHFLPPPPSDRYRVDHKNGNKHDPHVSNLEYVLPSENTRRAFKNGLCSGYGETHYYAKLKNDDIPVIIKRWLDGESVIKIAKDYPVSSRTIRAVINRERFKLIELPKELEERLKNKKRNIPGKTLFDAQEVK